MQPVKLAAQISETTGFSGNIVAASGFRSRLSIRPELIAPSLKPKPQTELILLILIVRCGLLGEGESEIVAPESNEGVLEFRPSPN